MGYHYDSRDSGCGCTGCLFILFIGAVIFGVILILLSALLQIVTGLVTMLIRLAILVLSIFVGLLILIPLLVALVYIIRNVIFAIRDAAADNHLYRKPLASPFKRFLSRFWGFTKDYWSYYLKHSVASIKDSYAKCGNATLRLPMRACYFLLMIALCFLTFVAPVLLVIFLLLYGVFMRHVVSMLMARVAEFFQNLLSFNSNVGG